MIVEEQAQPHHPGGARRLGLRKDEGQRPDDVRRHVQQPLALDQRLSHQPELTIFQIAQAAMDQLGRGRGGVARQIVLLDQQHRQAAPGGVARDPRAVDAAADDQQVYPVHRMVRHTACPCS